MYAAISRARCECWCRLFSCRYQSLDRFDSRGRWSAWVQVSGRSPKALRCNESSLQQLSVRRLGCSSQKAGFEETADVSEEKEALITIRVDGFLCCTSTYFLPSPPAPRPTRHSLEQKVSPHLVRRKAMSSARHLPPWSCVGELTFDNWEN